jgi:type VI protein secretion system component VasK
MNKLGGYLILIVTTLCAATLLLITFTPVFLSPDYFPWSILVGCALAGLILFGAIRKISAAEFQKTEEPRSGR